MPAQAKTVDLTTQVPPSLDSDHEALLDDAPDEVAASARAELATLDRHSRAFLTMVRSAISGWSSPTSLDVAPPAHHATLKKATLPFAALYLPVEDEDWPASGIVRNVAMRALRSPLFPLTDQDGTWQSEAEGVAGLQEALPPSILPAPTNTWTEMRSDEAMSRIAFAGLGALRLAPLEDPSKDPDGAVWVSDWAFLSDLAVRPGFEKYGAIAFFDRHQNPVRIHWCHARRDVRPGDAEWDHAKWAWRCSLLVGTTVTDHLVGVHWLIGNLVTTAVRESFDTDHPLRRLFKPFTFRTITINYNAVFSLCPTRGFVHRATALTAEALREALGASVGMWHYTTAPEIMQRKQAEALGEDFPFVTDGLAYWHVVRRFVERYVQAYFGGDAAVRDPQVRHFWERISNATEVMQIRPLTEDNLIDMITQFIWCVTGLHEHVGAVVEYVTNPTFAGTKIRPGTEMSDVQTSVQALLILGLTGLKQPQLIEDFTHIALDTRGQQLFRDFQKDLVALSAEIDRKNETRRFPYNMFNPRFLECSVSI